MNAALKNMLVSLSLSTMVLFNGACNQTNTPNTVLFTPETIQKTDLSFMTGKCPLVQNEKIIYAYSLNKVAKGFVLLTTEQLAIYKNETVIKEQLADIFDMAISHSDTSIKNSAITIYKKDNSEFFFEFAPKTAIDDQFFKALMDNWRKAVAKKQPVVADTAKAVEGDMIGIKSNKQPAQGPAGVDQ